MDLAALLLALPTVFLAAFLAVLLENTRERYRTRKWVVRNLQAMAAGVAELDVPPSLQAQVEALRRWLAAESPTELDEEVWQQAHMKIYSPVADLSSLIRSEAATSVPAEVFRALYELENAVAMLKIAEKSLNEGFTRDVLPLWYERRAPLTEAEARRVTTHLRLLAQYQELFQQLIGVITRFREAVNAL